jgi:hypothetical protein
LLKKQVEVDLKLIFLKKKKLQLLFCCASNYIFFTQKNQDAFPISMSTMVTKEFDTAGFRYRNRGKGCKIQNQACKYTR